MPALLPFPLPLCHQLDDAAGLGDLLLGVPANVAGLHDEREARGPALAEELRVTEREQIDDGGCVLGRARDVLLAHIGRKEGGEL